MLQEQNNKSIIYLKFVSNKNNYKFETKMSKKENKLKKS